MSKEPRRSTDPRAAARSTSEHPRKVRHKKRPCGNPPAAPTGLSTTWQSTDAGRFDRIRGRLRWNEVTLDTGGLSTRIASYHGQIQHSKDQVSWSDPERFKVAAKDQDADTTAHYVLKNVRKRLFYRWRVRAEDVDGCKGAWSAYAPSSAGENPADPDAPPAPTNVTLTGGTDRVVAEWDLAEDPDDTDPDVRTVDPRITHVQYQLAKSGSFTPQDIVKKGRMGTKERVSLKVPEGQTYWFRVRTMNAEGTRSAWVVANQGAGVIPGPKGGKLVLVWSIHGQLQVRRIKKRWIADGTYVPKKARIYVGDHVAANHPASDGCPRGSRVRVQLWKVSADESAETAMFDSDDRLVVDPDTHKDVNFASSFAVTQIVEGEQIFPEVRSVGSSFAGEDATISLILEPA